jgi:hypothetical protein
MLEIIKKTDIPKELWDPLLRAPEWAFLFPCLALRIGMGLVLLLSQNHIAHRIILGLLAFTWVALGLKFLKLGLHVWKDYVKFLVLIGIAIILLGLSWTKHQDWLVKPAGILVILDAVLGWQARFLTSNFNYILSKRGL